MWSAKGRFGNALKDNEPVSWDRNPKGELTLSLLMVIFFSCSCYI
jgi:hypothetical protein